MESILTGTLTYLEPEQRADLSARVATKLASLQTYAASIPPSDTAPNMREANAREQARQQLPLRISRLRAGIAALERRRWPELDRARREHVLLTEAREAMAALLIPFDGLTSRERSDRADERAALIAAVQVCDGGLRWSDAEPAPLRAFLRARGEVRLPGRDGLGTVAATRARLLDLEEQCRALEAQLERALAQPIGDALSV